MSEITYKDNLSPDLFKKTDRSRLDNEEIVRPSVSYWQGVWRRFKEDRMAKFCVALIIIMILMAIIAPLFSPYQYDATSLLETNLAPCREHWFGTDTVGRDIWTRIWVGARVSFAVGFIGAIIPFVIGMVIGSISGWCGGWVDMIIMRIIDVGLCIPSMIYLILVIVYFGAGAKSIIIALALMMWMGPARGYRGRVLQFKNREFTLAARTLGASPGRIIFRHILPNILGSIMVSLTSAVPSAMFVEASMAFIGLGIAPPMTSLGQLASDGAAVYRIHFYQFMIPSLILGIIIFAFFMLGNCLRDELDPQLREEFSTRAWKRKRRQEMKRGAGA